MTLQWERGGETPHTSNVSNWNSHTQFSDSSRHFIKVFTTQRDYLLIPMPDPIPIYRFFSIIWHCNVRLSFRHIALPLPCLTTSCPFCLRSVTKKNPALSNPTERPASSQQAFGCHFSPCFLPYNLQSLFYIIGWLYVLALTFWMEVFKFCGI